MITYNTIRPQKALKGNTPFETFNACPINFNQYKPHFNAQKHLRIQTNKNSDCNMCIKTKKGKT